MRRTSLLIVPLLLAACQDQGSGTSFTISGNDADGNAHGASIDGATGKVKVDLPGFEGSFSLPKVRVTAENFDLNGVRLYPGTSITGVNVDAGGASRQEHVEVRFDSPAPAKAVRDYLQSRLTKAGYVLSPEGDGLKGTTEDKAPFVLRLRDSGPDRSTGTIVIG